MGRVLDLLNDCHKALKEQQVPEPYEITLPYKLWRQLEMETVARPKRVYMGEVFGMKVYVDATAPPGQIRFGGVK